MGVNQRLGNGRGESANETPTEEASLHSTKWDLWQKQIYTSFTPPPFTARLIDFEAMAKVKLHNPVYNYAAGSAGLGETAMANRQAFKAWKILPRMLRDANTRDTSIELFGVTYPSSIFLAPVGVLGIFHPEGELAVARAARQTSVPVIVSTATTRTLEDIAEANTDGKRWFQLYWPESDDLTLSLLSRARASGYTTLVVTLDTSALGYRPENINAAYLPFLEGIGCINGFCDPVFAAKVGVQPDKDMLKNHSEETIRKYSAEWSKEVNSGRFRTWADISFLQEHWEGPVVLKGIQTVADARMALELGINGIVVSNHGGRQVDGAISSLSALAEITADPVVKKSNLTILFDSGIRTGSDVIIAMALGAKAVLVGRPYVYGLAVGGQEGVEHIIHALMADLDLTMGLMGQNAVKDLSRVNLRAPSRADYDY